MCSIPTSRGRRRCTSLGLSAYRPCLHPIVATRSLNAPVAASSSSRASPCSSARAHDCRSTIPAIAFGAATECHVDRGQASAAGATVPLAHRTSRTPLGQARRRSPCSPHDLPLTEGPRASDRCGPDAHEVLCSPEPSVPVCAQNPDSSILRRPNSPPDTMCATMVASASSPSRTRKACRICRCSC